MRSVPGDARLEKQTKQEWRGGEAPLKQDPSRLSIQALIRIATGEMMLSTLRLMSVAAAAMGAAMVASAELPSGERQLETPTSFHCNLVSASVCNPATPIPPAT